MPEPCSPQPLGAFEPDENSDDGQCVSRSRPVSFYDNYKVAQTTQPCVTSAMSVGNLSQNRDCSVTFAQPPSNGTNNNSISTNNNDYASSRVSNAASAGNVSKIQAPKVTGAVSTGHIGKTAKEKELGKAPSMANCLSTTVPVNLAASQIAGRHTPTRNSLRHSRMIVMHRTGNIPRKVQQPLLRHRRLAHFLASMQIILGVVVTSLSLWLLLWAPNLPVTDNPYWSGMPLLLSGSFGVCLLCCFKKEYPGMNPGFCLNITKFISISLALLSTLASLVACLASLIHLIKLTQLECSSTMFRNTSCTCKTPETKDNVVLKYEDLSCSEVENILIILLIFSATCNGLGAFVSGWYSYLHWITRMRTPTYISVRTNANNTTVSVNDRCNRTIYNSNHYSR